MSSCKPIPIHLPSYALEMGSGGKAPQTASAGMGERKPVDKEALMAVIQAIKFSQPEITNAGLLRTIRANHPEEFSGLSDPVFKATLKKWNAKQDELAKAAQQGPAVKLFTVGGNTSDGSLATAVAAQLPEGMGYWVVLEDGVPMDRSGTKPHQALISYVNKKSSKKAGKDGREVFKVQVAEGGADVRHPMLLYNQDRKHKTFIHPEVPGYDRIRSVVLEEGKEGKLKAGGLKAFFNGTIDKKAGVLLIDTENTAPQQGW